MVMANAMQTGNWHQDRGMSNESSEGSKVTLGMKATLPPCFPPSMWHFRAWGLTSNSIRHVPLQRPWDGSIFLGSIKGQPSLTRRWARGRPDTLRSCQGFANDTGEVEWEGNPGVTCPSCSGCSQ